MDKYDYIVIGAGPAGLFFTYKMIRNNPLAKICIIEKGNELSRRSCPMVTNRIANCQNCNPCNIMCGLAGAGAYSDGKFNKSNDYGGDLSNYIGREMTSKYIDQADDIFLLHGATSKIYTPSNKIKEMFEIHGFKVLQGIIRHLGTDGSYRVMNSLIEDLRNNVNIITNACVTNVSIKDKIVSMDRLSSGYELEYNQLIIAVGRSGCDWFSRWCNDNNISTTSGQIDIGVRVELKRSVWRDIVDQVYECKLLYETKKYRDIVRTFCANDGGYVVAENVDGIVTVNGHANFDENKKSQNSNFAILSSIKLTEPFNRPVEYVNYVAGLTNMMSNGGILVQKFGDLVNGRRTTTSRLNNSNVCPTLGSAIPGDLSLCFPMRQLKNIIEMIYRLDRVVTGTAGYDTLLYGAEVKRYSLIPSFISNNFQIYRNIYAIGDCAGISRSLSYASCSGLCLADIIDRS